MPIYRSVRSHKGCCNSTGVNARAERESHLSRGFVPLFRLVGKALVRMSNNDGLGAAARLGREDFRLLTRKDSCNSSIKLRTNVSFSYWNANTLPASIRIMKSFYAFAFYRSLL